MPDHCKSCGSADLGTFMCHYCGAPLFPLANEEDQRSALDELHAQVTVARAGRTRTAILENGFLPDHPRVLVDAGLRMVPVLEHNVSEGPAAGRMRAIIFKLRLLRHDADAMDAAEKLDAHLKRYERHDRLIGSLAMAALAIFFVVVCVSVVGLAVVFGAMWVFGG